MSKRSEIEQARLLPVDRSDRWVIGRKPVNIHIDELGDIMPEACVCISLTLELIIGGTIVSPMARDSEVLSWILGCMLSPMVGDPRRPASLTLLGDKLGPLQADLAKIGVLTDTSSQPCPIVDEALSALENNLAQPGIPPYLDRPSDDPETVAEFFQAAASFYRLKPWKLFSGEVPIRVRLSRKKAVTYYAIVMGVEGQEFGVSLYRSMKDLDAIYYADDADMLDVAYSIWSMGFSFDDFDSVGSAAKAERMLHEWPMATESAFPSAIVVDPKGNQFARRPKKKELVDLTVVTLALTEYLRQHKQEVKDQIVLPEELWDVEAFDTVFDVAIACPAPEYVEESEKLSLLEFLSDQQQKPV